MFSVILGVLVCQGQGLPSSYIGLYADRSDRAFVVTSPSTIEYNDGDQWGIIAGLYQAPNNDFVGTWAQSKTLTAMDSAHWAIFDHGKRWKDSAWNKAQSESYRAYKAPFIGILQADNVRYTGEFRAKFLSNSTFTGKFTDSKGIDFNNTTLSYLGTYDKVRVGGVYKDKYTDMNLTETFGSTKWDAEGTFSHLGKKYNVRGERLYTRGRLDIIDPSTGRTVGFCIYGYTPSKAQVKAFRSGNFEPTDTVLLNFVVPGSPTVQVKALSR